MRLIRDSDCTRIKTEDYKRIMSKDSKDPLSFLHIV